MPYKKRYRSSHASSVPLILIFVVAAGIVGWSARLALSGDAPGISATTEEDAVERGVVERDKSRAATVAGVEVDAPGDAPRGGAQRDTPPGARPAGARGKQEPGGRSKGVGASKGQTEADSPKGAPPGRTRGDTAPGVASGGATLQPTSAQRDSGARGGGWPGWAALVLAGAGLVAAFRLSRALNQLRYEVEELRGSQTRRSLSEADRPQRSAWTPDPEPEADWPAFNGLVDEVRALKRCVEETLEEVHALQQKFDARHGQDVPHPTQVTAAPSRTGQGAAAEGVRILKGTLSKDEVVRLNNSHRPMIEIRWREGADHAEAWINPNFKFADLTAALLETAFHLEGGGTGAYDTLAPAVIDWDPTSSQGHVRQKGRARARP